MTALTPDTPTSTPDVEAERARPDTALAALAGVVAAAVGLAAGDAAAGISRSWRSPVVAVGDRFIDVVPPPVKDLAIQLFGTADKIALIAGILSVLAAVAAGLGVASFRGRLRWGILGSAGFAAVGGIAASRAPTGDLGSTVPSLVAGVCAAGAFWGLARWFVRPASRPGSQQAPARADRRRFLVGIGVGAVIIAGGASVGRALKARAAVTGERLALVLPRARRPLRAAPAGLEGEIPGLTPLIVPNRDFYRIDTALTVPAVSVADWTLRIHGMVDDEVELTFDELLERELIETDVTIACVSNEVGDDLVGNARWLGVRLDDLLAEAGIDRDADQIVGRSVDGWTAGFPVRVLDGRDAIVAVGMNGEPLPVEHGYPARLIVPGLYGYVSATKWLSEIELTRFDRFEGYWVPRGWSAEGPIKTQSRIDTPRGGASAGPVAIAGVAWAGTRRIERVEVRVDDGPWQEADLGVELSDTSWRQWHLAWDATPGSHRLQVRATDGDGDTQPEERTPVAPDGATGWHTVSVQVAA